MELQIQHSKNAANYLCKLGILTQDTYKCVSKAVTPTETFTHAHTHTCY